MHSNSTGAGLQAGLALTTVTVARYERDMEWRLATAMVQAVRGERTPKQALDETVRDIHEIIDRDRAAQGLFHVKR
jgi:hypothetical protein